VRHASRFVSRERHPLGGRSSGVAGVQELQNGTVDCRPNLRSGAAANFGWMREAKRENTRGGL
jgi:hypothetical protein